jgi:hypothetical protein
MQKRDRLLMQAAFCCSDRAVKAWKGWLEIGEMDDFPSDRMYLGPSLYQNLSQAGLNTAAIRKLGGIFRYTWTKNQEEWRGYKAVLRQLNQSRIPLLYLPNSALVLENGGVSGRLPLNPLNLFVRWESAERAISVLEENTWEPIPGVELHKREAYLHAASEHLFRNPTGMDIRLHWSLVGNPAFDERIWRNAEPAGDWGSQPGLEHQALLASLPQRRDPDLYHLVLLAIILGDGPGIRWDTLQEEAREFNLELFFKRGLLELSELCPEAVPEDVVFELRETEPQSSDQTEFLLVRYKPGLYTRLKALRLEYKLADDAGLLLDQDTGFLEYLQQRLHRDGLISTLVYGLKKIAGDIRFRLGKN